MSEFLASLAVIAVLVLPVLFIVWLILALLKKPIAKKLGLVCLVCLGSIIPLIVLSSITNPDNAPCNHSYVVKGESVGTCNAGGMVTKVCSLCEDELIEYTPALGHSMVEVSRTEPTYELEGAIVYQCERCGQRENTHIAKLEYTKVSFDGLELTFGEYSFVTVDNMFSEYDGKTVVKIPVTVYNKTNDPHGLNYFYYKLFSTSGLESNEVGFYFDDDMSKAGTVLPGKSYTAYLHIIYDGDGVYTIVLDNWLLDKKTIEIEVKQ